MASGWKQYLFELSAANIPNLDASKIVSGSFDVARIPNLSAAKITSGTFGTAFITDLAITEGKIAALAVTEGKIGALAVTEGKIGALAVTEGKIGALAVTTDKLAAGAVTTAKMNIDSKLDFALNEAGNLIIEKVSTLPTIASGSESANEGRAIYLTTVNGTNQPGLYVYKYEA